MDFLVQGLELGLELGTGRSGNLGLGVVGIDYLFGIGRISYSSIPIIIEINLIEISGNCQQPT